MLLQRDVFRPAVGVAEMPRRDRALLRHITRFGIGYLDGVRVDGNAHLPRAVRARSRIHALGGYGDPRDPDVARKRRHHRVVVCFIQGIARTDTQIIRRIFGRDKTVQRRRPAVPVAVAAVRHRRPLPERKSEHFERGDVEITVRNKQGCVITAFRGVGRNVINKPRRSKRAARVMRTADRAVGVEVEPPCRGILLAHTRALFGIEIELDFSVQNTRAVEVDFHPRQRPRKLRVNVGEQLLIGADLACARGKFA